jgi:hypothetical protein
MAARGDTLPSPTELARRVSVFSALKQRRRHQSNIWFFDSPKNNRRFTITGDVAFMHFVLLEGDVSVESYDPAPEPVRASIDGEVRETELDAHVRFKGGQIEWWEFKRREDSGPSKERRSRPELSAQAQAAAAAGVRYQVRTDLDLQHKEVLFDNWLTLCAGITRCRNQPIYREADLFTARLALQKSISFGSLMDIPGIDHAHMLAVVAVALQNGTVQADLEKSLFGRESTLTRRLS